MDQRLSYYRPHIKTLSWVPTMLTHFFNVSVVNAYILYKEYFGLAQKYTLLKFILALIDDLSEPLILERKSTKIEAVAMERQFMTKKSWSNNWIMRSSGIHRAIIIEDSRIDHDNIQRHMKRGHCINCRKIVNTFCNSCKVHLCILTDGETETCFDVFHDRKVLQ